MSYLRMTVAVAGLWLCMAASAQEGDWIEVRLFDGRLIRGKVLRETAAELTVQTIFGQRLVLRHEMVDYRKALAPDERAELERALRAADSTPDREAAHRATAEPGPGETTVARRSDAAAQAPAGSSVASRRPEPPGPWWSARKGDWAERMALALDRHVSVEFVDNSLEEALSTLGQITDLNIILDPKLRDKKLKVTLSVRAMEVANVLKWITRLTDTYADVLDQAIYVTDKPAKTGMDEERMEAVGLMARAGVDMSLLPPEGQEFTEADRARIAMAIWEKENPAPTDFPAPQVDLAAPENFLVNPFSSPRP